GEVERDESGLKAHLVIEESLSDFAEGLLCKLPVAETGSDFRLCPAQTDKIQRLRDPTEEVLDCREKACRLFEPFRGEKEPHQVVATIDQQARLPLRIDQIESAW